VIIIAGRETSIRKMLYRSVPHILVAGELYMPWLRGLDKEVSRKRAEKSESTALDNNVGTGQVEEL
jgi:hypothetical protein